MPTAQRVPDVDVSLAAALLLGLTTEASAGTTVVGAAAGHPAARTAGAGVGGPTPAVRPIRCAAGRMRAHMPLAEMGRAAPRGMPDQVGAAAGASPGGRRAGAAAPRPTPATAEPQATDAPAEVDGLHPVRLPVSLPQRAPVRVGRRAAGGPPPGGRRLPGRPGRPAADLRPHADRDGGGGDGPAAEAAARGAPAAQCLVPARGAPDGSGGPLGRRGPVPGGRRPGVGGAGGGRAPAVWRAARGAAAGRHAGRQLGRSARDRPVRSPAQRAARRVRVRGPDRPGRGVPPVPAVPALARPRPGGRRHVLPLAGRRAGPARLCGQRGRIGCGPDVGGRVALGTPRTRRLARLERPRFLRCGASRGRNRHAPHGHAAAGSPRVRLRVDGLQQPGPVHDRVGDALAGGPGFCGGVSRGGGRHADPRPAARDDTRAGPSRPVRGAAAPAGGGPQGGPRRSGALLPVQAHAGDPPPAVPAQTRHAKGQVLLAGRVGEGHARAVRVAHDGHQGAVRQPEEGRRARLRPALRDAAVQAHGHHDAGSPGSTRAPQHQQTRAHPADRASAAAHPLRATVPWGRLCVVLRSGHARAADGRPCRATRPSTGRALPRWHFFWGPYAEAHMSSQPQAAPSSAAAPPQSVLQTAGRPPTASRPASPSSGAVGRTKKVSRRTPPAQTKATAPTP
eukprot:scaffold10292_cov103-Isochrysis_galbana.AAC.2